MDIKKMPNGEFGVDSESIEIVRDTKAPYVPILKAIGGGSGSGSNSLDVTITFEDYSNCSCDKTFAEIAEAYPNINVSVVQKLGGQIQTIDINPMVTYYYNQGFIFTSTYYSTSGNTIAGLSIYQFKVLANNSISFDMGNHSF